MAKLASVKRKINPLAMIDRDLYDQLQPLGAQTETANAIKKEQEKALKELEANPGKDVIPMVDEEELARVRRRRIARRSGGRASTMLAPEERFGG
jgi:predicted Zn-dependent peptidase